MRAYYYEVWKTALTEFQGFWTAHKLASSMPSPLVGFIAWAILKGGLHSWKDLMQAVLVSVLCSLVAFALTLLVSFARAPKILDDKRQETIRSLAKPAPTRTVVEEYRLQTVKTAIEKHGPDTITILRHLRTLGKMLFEMGGPILPSGIDSPRASQILQILKKEGIVESERIPLTGNLGYKTLWRITSEMESAIDDLLRSQSTNS